MMPVINRKHLDTHKGVVLTHAVIWKIGRCTFGFIRVNLESDGQKNNKYHLDLIATQ